MSRICLHIERIVVMGVTLGWKRCRRLADGASGYCGAHRVVEITGRDCEQAAMNLGRSE